jgi:hypothetical protein
VARVKGAVRVESAGRTVTRILVSYTALEWEMVITAFPSLSGEIRAWPEVTGAALRAADDRAVPVPLTQAMTGLPLPSAASCSICQAREDSSPGAALLI